ncbi:ribosome-associated translation inhibitor RaiA [Desulfosarcina sp. OttesenSCG-928-A07]|nr:ribosome-associated translation inhibitor RaiA [Desulfosarcina sp. OttesenSCG-928-G17]MDL2329537.1 ribosome-associated translation inhibitor RaiA [Desulfosarcina sp. OttesenSCG-928-A07]
MINTAVRFKNLESSDALRDYVHDKMGRLEKYFSGPVEASVVLSIEKFRHIAEISITGDRLAIHGKEETEEMYAAIDMIVDKLDAQIKKSKQKNRFQRERGKFDALPDEGSPEAASEESSRVQAHAIEYKPMDVDEAVLQMDLITDQFLVFTNSRTNAVNVLYRRKNGNYGLIEPLS